MTCRYLLMSTQTQTGQTFFGCFPMAANLRALDRQNPISPILQSFFQTALKTSSDLTVETGGKSSLTLMASAIEPGKPATECF
jgi:hypothetical protein